MRYLPSTLLLLVGLFGSAVLLSGCGANESVDEAPPAEEAAEAAAAPADVPPEVAEARAELPEADRQLVVAQEVCPVSGKTLGSMGKPIKLTVDGREVFICCEGCEEPLKSEPQKHLETLDSQGV